MDRSGLVETGHQWTGVPQGRDQTKPAMSGILGIQLSLLYTSPRLPCEAKPAWGSGGSTYAGFWAWLVPGPQADSHVGHEPQIPALTLSPTMKNPLHPVISTVGVRRVWVDRLL